MTEPRDITHAETCADCGRDTFRWERYCVACGADRWSQ